MSSAPALHSADPRVKGITLAHNRGQQAALLAGLMSVRERCDAAITIDADLQDNPEMMRRMIELFSRGTDIVYGVRSSRDSDSWFKRVSAQTFYRFQSGRAEQAVYVRWMAALPARCSRVAQWLFAVACLGGF